LNLAKIMETKRYMESGLEREEFQNIKDEVLKTIEISYETNNITNKTEAFVGFARDVLKTRTMDFNALVVQTIHLVVSPGAETILNVTVLNYLGSTIETLNLSFSYDPSANKTFSSITDTGRVDTSFTFIAVSDTYFTLTIYYKISSENMTESILVPVEIGKSKLTSFFDLRLISSRGENRDKFNKTCTLS